jgi:hypothetical protein
VSKGSKKDSKGYKYRFFLTLLLFFTPLRPFCTSDNAQRRNFVEELNVNNNIKIKKQGKL